LERESRKNKTLINFENQPQRCPESLHSAAFFPKGKSLKNDKYKKFSFCKGKLVFAHFENQAQGAQKLIQQRVAEEYGKNNFIPSETNSEKITIFSIWKIR
jgi:hypothetical protein